MTVGCAKAFKSPSKPKAHFSLRFFTCGTSRPAASAGWNRAFVDVELQPFHCFFELAASLMVRSAQYAAAGVVVASDDAAPRKDATASRSSRRSGYAIAIMTPKSSARRILDAGILCNVSRAGAREFV